MIAGTMALMRRVPWRKLKVVVLFLLCYSALHLAWMYAGSTYFEQTSSDGSSSSGSGSMFEALKHPGNFLVNAPGHMFPHIHRQKVVQSTCKKVVPLKDRICTYDLPDETDYSMDQRGKYKVPQQFYDLDKTSTPETDEHVDVILVPFSHADPGYGATFEGYYTQRFQRKCL